MKLVSRSKDTDLKRETLTVLFLGFAQELAECDAVVVSAGLLRQVLPSGPGRRVVAGVRAARQRRPPHPVRRARDERGRELLPQPRHHSQATTTAARVSD